LSADIGVDPVFTAGRPFFFWFFQDTCLFYYFRAEPKGTQDTQEKDAMQMSDLPGHNENLFNIKVNYF